jgi:hypothetical protein
MLSRLMSGGALAAVTGAAMLAATTVPSNAFTLSSPSLERPIASFGVEDVWWGRGGWGWHRPWGWGWHRPWGWGWHRPWGWGWHRPWAWGWGGPVRHCWGWRCTW